MSQPMLARWLAVLLAPAALTVSAQVHTMSAGAPAAPISAAPPPMPAVAAMVSNQAAPYQFRSALEGYQPFSDNKRVPWKEANDTVGKIGGWRAYAEEAAGAKDPGDATPAPGDAVKSPAGPRKP